MPRSLIKLFTIHYKETPKECQIHTDLIRFRTCPTCAKNYRDAMRSGRTEDSDSSSIKSLRNTFKLCWRHQSAMIRRGWSGLKPKRQIEGVTFYNFPNKSIGTPIEVKGGVVREVVQEISESN